MTIRSAPPVPAYSEWVQGGQMTQAGHEFLANLYRMNTELREAVVALEDAGAGDGTPTRGVLQSRIEWYAKGSTTDFTAFNTTETATTVGISLTNLVADSITEVTVNLNITASAGQYIFAKLYINGTAYEEQAVILTSYTASQLVFRIQNSAIVANGFTLTLRSASGTCNIHSGGGTWIRANEISQD